MTNIIESILIPKGTTASTLPSVVVPMLCRRVHVGGNYLARQGLRKKT